MFGIVALLFLILFVTGKDRWASRTADLQQQIDELKSTNAELQTQRADLHQKVTQMDSSYGSKIAGLQRQVAERNQEIQRHQSNLESRATEMDRVQRQLVQFRTRAAQDATELDRLNSAASAVAPPSANRFENTRIVLLHSTPDGPPNAIGSANFDLVTQKGILIVENLVTLSNDRDYNLWLLDPNYPSPITAGPFRVNERGNARIEFTPASPVRSVERFVITIERRGGPASPQGRLVMTGS